MPSQDKDAFQTVRQSAFEIHPDSVLNAGEDVSVPQAIYLRVFFVTAGSEFLHPETHGARMPGASSLVEEGEDGQQAAPALSPALDSPGPLDGRSSPGALAWGSAPGAPGPALGRSPASHPDSDFTAARLPLRAVHALGAAETTS